MVVILSTLDDLVNVLAEVLTDWKINQDLLEECYHVSLSGQLLNSLEALELSKRVLGSACGYRVDAAISLGGHEADDVLDLVGVHHHLEELSERR